MFFAPEQRSSVETIRQGGGVQSFKAYRDTAKKLRLNWDCTEVLSMAPIARKNIEQDLLFLCP